MAIKTAIELEVKQPTLKGFRQELREAKLAAEQAVMTFGEFSPEALKATQRVAELRDRMEDFNDRVTSLNPDKFSQLNIVVSSVARGFQAAQGAMGLFGEDSKNLEKTLVKLQSAMAFAEGLEGLGKLQQQFGAIALTIKESVLAAFGTFKAAISSLGIGALVASIGYVIEKLSTMKSEEELVQMRLDLMSKSVDNQSKSFEKLNEQVAQQVDFQLKLAQAMGASAYEQYIIEIEGLSKQIKNTNDTIITLTEERNKKIASINAQIFSKNAQERQKEIDSINNIYNPKILALQNEQNNKMQEMEILAAKETKRQEDEDKARREKNAQIAQEQARKNAEERKKLNEEEYQRLFELEKARERDRETINSITSKGIQLQNDLILGQAQEVSIKLQQIEIDKYDKLKTIAYLYHADIAQMAIDSLNVIAELNTQFANKDEASQKKAFDINKKIRIATTVIDSTEATLKAFKSAQDSPITSLFPGYPFVQAAIAAAWGVAKVKQIQNTQYSTSSVGNTNGGTPNISIPTPSFNTGSTLGEDMGGGKVYVLEGDIRRVTQRVNANRMVSVSE